MGWAEPGDRAGGREEDTDFPFLFVCIGTSIFFLMRLYVGACLSILDARCKCPTLS